MNMSLKSEDFEQFVFEEAAGNSLIERRPCFDRLARFVVILRMNSSKFDIKVVILSMWLNIKSVQLPKCRIDARITM